MGIISSEISMKMKPSKIFIVPGIIFGIQKIDVVITCVYFGGSYVEFSDSSALLYKGEKFQP